MKYTILIAITFAALTTSAFADARVDSYDGMIHLDLDGKVARDYFNAIRVRAYDNGAALVKILNDRVSCDMNKNLKTYQCTISMDAK